MHESLSEWWNSISLRSKITGVTVLVLAFGILVAGIGTMAMLKPALLGQVDERLKSSAESLANFGKIPQSAVSEQGSVASSNDYFYVFYEPSTGLAFNHNWETKPAGSLPEFPDQLHLSQATGAQLTPFSLDSRNGSAHFRAVMIPVSYKDLPEQGVMLVAASTREAENIIATYLTIFFGLGLAVILFGAALTRLLVTSTFAPLREVEHTAAAIAEGDFSQRLAVSTPNTEVGRLNRSLNTMLNRIDRAFTDRANTIGQMRRFVGDASHELRTPLVTVRGYAELYRMGALQTTEDVSQAMERIEKEAIRMGALVEDLLELARLDETKPLNLGVLDLSALARDAVMDARAASPGRTVNIVIDRHDISVFREQVAVPPRPPLPAESPDGPRAITRPPALLDAPAVVATPAPSGAATLVARLRGRKPRKFPSARIMESLPPTASATPSVPILDVPAIVLAEENKIRQVVTNLMGNAMRFTEVDSPIEIGVSANAATGFATLAVIDHGEGIPEPIRDKIFQRFWRADTSRARETGGSGLGLAIVSSIVKAHHGTVSITETPGGGATFRVCLPLLTAGPEPELPEQDA